MVARRERIRHVERARAVGFLTKATEFYEAMQQALTASRWNAVGLTAVHCAISACDAVLVHYTEQRSAILDHEEAAQRLAQLTAVTDAPSKAETLRRILHYKHSIEYEDRPFEAGEAAHIAKLAERFYLWTREIVPRERTP